MSAQDWHYAPLKYFSRAIKTCFTRIGGIAHENLDVCKEQSANVSTYIMYMMLIKKVAKLYMKL